MAALALSRFSHVLAWSLAPKRRLLRVMGVTSQGPDIPCLGLAGEQRPQTPESNLFCMVGLQHKKFSTHHSVQFTWRQTSFLPLHVHPHGHREVLGEVERGW